MSMSNFVTIALLIAIVYCTVVLNWQVRSAMYIEARGLEYKTLVEATGGNYD